MSVVCFFRPGSRARTLNNDVPKWISNSAHAPYIQSVCVSFPDWVDRHDMKMLGQWAKVMGVFTKEKYVLDHMIPINHPNVCGLSVPWNFQVIHWRANGVKGNDWNPDQLRLF